MYLQYWRSYKLLKSACHHFLFWKYGKNYTSLMWKKNLVLKNINHEQKAMIWLIKHASSCALRHLNFYQLNLSLTFVALLRITYDTWFLYSFYCLLYLLAKHSAATPWHSAEYSTIDLSYSYAGLSCSRSMIQTCAPPIITHKPPGNIVSREYTDALGRESLSKEDNDNDVDNISL